MTRIETAEQLDEYRGVGYPYGSREHPRAFVCNTESWDRIAAQTLYILVQLGLREWHRVLDVGCGCLRVGRLLVPWLAPDRYRGLEPERWLVRAGIDEALGRELLAKKRPVFRHEADFDLAAFGEKFDLVFAHSVLVHCSEAQLEACLRSAAAVLAPAGGFLATLNFGVGEEGGNAGAGWTYPEAVDHSMTFVARTANAAGLDTHFVSVEHVNDMGQQWVLFTPSIDDYLAARPWVRAELG